MRRLLFAGLVATAGLAIAQQLWAMMAAPPPLCDRIAGADCVIVGKVTSIEDKPVMIPPNSSNPVRYQIAVVQVGEALAGAKGLTHVRVAFQPPPPAPPPSAPPKRGQPQAFPIRKNRGFFTLTVGQEGIFILKKHPGETFFDPPGMWNFVAKGKDPNYDKRLASVKRIAKSSADPAAGLKSTAPEERATAAVILLSRYRKFPGPNAKEEPIDAAQSKAILLALADGNWGPTNFFSDEASAATAFNALLRPTAQDGWNPPKPQRGQDYRVFQKEYETAAKKWLKDHAGTYRIKRYVAPKK
jgi:hypothetical protein